MASGGKKIADGYNKMAPSPIIAWIRDKLLRSRRRVDKDMEKVVRKDFDYQQRYPSDQSARTQPPAAIPGGVHHKLAQNYYLDHDARRAIDPPKVISGGDADAGKYQLIAAQVEKDKLAAIIGPQVCVGPAQNFGLPPRIPTPGFGHEWTRSYDEELPTQQNDEEFVPLQRYDAYRQQ